MAFLLFCIDSHFYRKGTIPSKFNFCMKIALFKRSFFLNMRSCCRVSRCVTTGEQGSWSDAIECYNSAISRGLLFDDFWVRSLQALQSLALSNKQPVPWQVIIFRVLFAESPRALCFAFINPLQCVLDE
jgi:hypothetical protein